MNARAIGLLTHAYCGRRSFTQTFADRPECPELPVTASVCSR